MSQSLKNILISVFVGIIIFLILAIGYNLKIIPISINVSNTIQSIQKQVDQIGIEFLGQVQIERAKMKDLAENSFIIDSFANQIITDKVYSEVYEYTVRNKNCYGITFVNNDKTIFFVYPPYASKRKGMVIASEYFNFFLTKEYSILPFQTPKEAQTTDEIVLGYPIQKDGKILGIALFHYSGTSLLTEPIKKTSLSIKGLAFVKSYNMIVFNVGKNILEEKDRFTDILAAVNEDNKTIGPIKVGDSKYYFFSSQISKSGKQVVVIPYEKVGTPLVVQIVISFYLITIIILITYVLLAFFFSPKEEKVELQGNKYYQKPPEFEEIKNEEEEEEFLSAVSSEEKKKDFFFEEVKSEKPLDTALKSLVEEVSQKKSPLEVTLDEQYVFTPPEPLTSEELPEISLESKEENIQLPDIEEEEVIEEKEFEKSTNELPSLEELEESKESYTELGKEPEIQAKEEFELPEEVVSISEEMKTLEEMEIPEIQQENIEEKGIEEIEINEKSDTFVIPDIGEEKATENEFTEELPPLEDFSEIEQEEKKTEIEVGEVEETGFTELPEIESQTETFEIPESIDQTSVEEEKLPSLEDLVEIKEEEVTNEEQSLNIESSVEPLHKEESEFTELPELEQVEEKMNIGAEDLNITENPVEEDYSVEKNEEFEIPPIEDLDKELPSMEIPSPIDNIDKIPEEILDMEPIGSIAEELETEKSNENFTEEVNVELKNISEEESEFFGDISSEEIALSAEELENVTKDVDQILENNEEMELPEIKEEDINNSYDEIKPDIENMEELSLPEINEEDIEKTIEESKSEPEGIENLDLPEINEEDFKNADSSYTETITSNELPYDDLCSSFVSKYQVDEIAFYKAEGDVFTCSGSSNPGFSEIQFEIDEPIIEKLSTLRKDIFIPEGINKFEPLLQKKEELFSNMNAMYVHGIFDEGQLLGAIFIFSSKSNEKDKEEYYHIATKLAELLV